MRTVARMSSSDYVMVSWGDGNSAAIEFGQVERASSPKARALVEKCLDKQRVSVWAGDDNVRYFEKGQPGFVRAALSGIIGATITGGD